MSVIQYNPDTLAALTVENLLNEKFTPYMNVLASQGVTVMGSLKIGFSDKTIRDDDEAGMTVRLMPQIGKTAAHRPEHLRRGDHDPAVTSGDASELLPVWSPLRWRSNVIPFVRPDDSGRRQAEAITIDPDARSVPPRRGGKERAWLLAFLLASTAAHSLALVVFEREPPPRASVGLPSISVEIVLGANAAAGLAKQPTQSEAALDSAASQGKATDLVKPEVAREELKARDTARPVEAETTKTETALPAAEIAPARQQVAELPMPEAKTVAPELQPITPATAPFPLATEPPKAVTARPKQKQEPRPVVHKHNDHGTDARTRESRFSSASIASSGIGRGRSDADTNYRGLVAAQLARNKNFPPDARRNGDQGNALVSFTIGSDGRVTGVSLVRAIGVASLDREAQAMVRRASPFPPPPSGRAMRFTAPVSFNIR